MKVTAAISAALSTTRRVAETSTLGKRTGSVVAIAPKNAIAAQMPAAIRPIACRSGRGLGRCGHGMRIGKVHASK